MLTPALSMLTHWIRTFCDTLPHVCRQRRLLTRGRSSIEDMAMQRPISQREQELLNLVDHLGPLREDLVRIPDAPKPMRVIRPASIDQLLDHAASDPEQHLPYWSELWPS